MTDQEEAIFEIEKEFLSHLHLLHSATFTKCMQEDISQIEIIRIIFMNTLCVLVDHSNALSMPREVFMQIVDKAYQIVKEVQTIREPMH